MIHGTYKFKLKEVDNFECPKAYSIFQSRAEAWHPSYNTCGSSALSLLTGIDVRKIENKLPKSNPHWSDLSITQFLKKRNYKVIQISKCGITNLSPHARDDEWNKEPITQNHVLLCGLLMCRNEGSWWVVNNNRTFHNFIQSELNPLLFVNKPSENIYVISHPSWK